jgi:uncharacterized protein YegP (UPF0339 family)
VPQSTAANVPSNSAAVSVPQSSSSNVGPWRVVGLVARPSNGYVLLQKEGYISKQLDSNSIALIIDTDGKHGKAIALQDAMGSYCFSKKPITSKNVC